MFTWNIVLGFDFGTKNIGVAVGQSITQTASPLKELKTCNGIPNWDKISHLVHQWEPDCFIIGIPWNMDGSTSQMQKKALKFANELTLKFKKKWYPVDERLSTIEAKQCAYQLGHKGDFGKTPIDSLTAQILLESWMDNYNIALSTKEKGT